MSYAIGLSQECLNDKDNPPVIWCPACGENLGELCSDKIEELLRLGEIDEYCFECGTTFYIDIDK